MKKIITYLGWASGGFGAILMLLGIIGFLTGGEFLGVRYFINWFYFANSFLFLGIFFLVAGWKCCCSDGHKE